MSLKFPHRDSDEFDLCHLLEDGPSDVGVVVSVVLLRKKRNFEFN